ncbi:hypothetical protein M0804_002240 [Polistes exclamans]|nr:hypothetical protein M0804_002240 [Polistes exclamans]
MVPSRNTNGKRTQKSRSHLQLQVDYRLTVSTLLRYQHHHHHWLPTLIREKPLTEMKLKECFEFGIKKIHIVESIATRPPPPPPPPAAAAAASVVVVGLNGHTPEGHERYVAMTSLILENADLNRLFPKCRPRGGPPPPPGGSTQTSQPHDNPCQTELASVTTITTSSTVTIASANDTTITTPSSNLLSAISDDMIDLERDTSDRQVISKLGGRERKRQK